MASHINLANAAQSKKDHILVSTTVKALSTAQHVIKASRVIHRLDCASWKKFPIEQICGRRVCKTYLRNGGLKELRLGPKPFNLFTLSRLLNKRSDIFGTFRGNNTYDQHRIRRMIRGRVSRLWGNPKSWLNCVKSLGSAILIWSCELYHCR